MLSDLKSNERGVVFVTVLIIIITTMVLTISALSLNISQIKSTENELKYIQAKVLADGGLFQIIANQFSSSPSNSRPALPRSAGPAVPRRESRTAPTLRETSLLLQSGLGVKRAA